MIFYLFLCIFYVRTKNNNTSYLYFNNRFQDIFEKFVNKSKQVDYK